MSLMVCFQQISDWWQQFVYLRSREPLMINSNYYGLVSIQHCWISDTMFDAKRWREEDTMYTPRREGVLPKNLGGGMWHAS